MQERIDKLNTSFSKLIESNMEASFSFDYDAILFLEYVFEGFMKTKGYKEANPKLELGTGCYFSYDKDSDYIFYNKSNTITDGVLKHLHDFDIWRNIILKYFNQFYIAETK